MATGILLIAAALYLWAWLMVKDLATHPHPKHRGTRPTPYDWTEYDDTDPIEPSPLDEWPEQ